MKLIIKEIRSELDVDRVVIKWESRRDYEVNNDYVEQKNSTIISHIN